MLESILIAFIVFSGKVWLCLAIYGIYDKVIIRNPRFWVLVEATKERYAHVRFTIDVSLRKFWANVYALEDKIQGKKDKNINYFRF